MSESIFWFIQKGTEGVTGNWTDSIYVIHLRGMKPERANSLKEAKECANRFGASGRFVKTMEPRGRRGKLLAIYRDAGTTE